MFGNLIGDFGNNPFLQSPDVLRADLQNIIKIIEDNEANALIPLFTQAFDYFVYHPDDYDGATGDEESGAAKKYDVPSIIHDYLSVIGLDYHYQLMRLTDRLFVAQMHALHFNSIQIAKRKIGLWLIAIPRWLRRRYMGVFDENYQNAVEQLDFDKWKSDIKRELTLLSQ